jgi:DNA polymerase elongation subunit (family B)
LNSAIGWLLDVYIQDDHACLSIRTDKGDVLSLSDTYHPSFYIMPQTNEDGKGLFKTLQAISNIMYLSFEEKYTVLGTISKERLLHVVIDTAETFDGILRTIELLPQVKAVYNGDLLHVQRYIFTKLNVAPTSKVEVTYSIKGKEKWLASIKTIDDSNELSPPPFKIIIFDIEINDAPLTSNINDAPITRIKIQLDADELTFKGGEFTILKNFLALLKTQNPDVLICSDADRTINYLLNRCRLLALLPSLRREVLTPPWVNMSLPTWFKERIVVDSAYFRAFGIVGLIERAKFSVLPPRLAYSWTANRIIDSRNCYELIKRDYVIPKNVGYYVYIRTLDDVFIYDRGSLILPPKTGSVHENIAELDFESEYPNLIVRKGLSYETVTSTGLLKNEDAILPYITKIFLDRRLRFKRLRTTLPKNSKEWRWCEQRQLALKAILVCLYGTSGCCWNRFGNVLCFEEINKRSRIALIETKNFIQQRDFELIYADTDSIFIKKKHATREDYENIAEEISKSVDLPMVLAHHYQFLLLLPLQSDSSGYMKAQKHYFGILTNHELLTRGIECRRHDSPLFIKTFQENLIKCLFDVETLEAVYSIGYKRALQYVSKTIDAVMRKKLSIGELIVSKTLRKPITEYTKLYPHVSASINLTQQGKWVRNGETIDFVYVNTQRDNPLRRVAPIALYDKLYYDSEKYRNMLLAASETILSSFGFSRQQWDLNPSITLP